MNIIELARLAEIGDSHGYIIANELKHLETFRRLVIEEHLKGVDVEPLGFMWQHEETGRVGFAEETQRPMWKKGNPRLNIITDIFTATQMAAVRNRALEEAAQACEAMPLTLAKDSDVWALCAARLIRALGVKK